MHRTLSTAMKGYDRPFLASGRKIIRLGINFSSQTRTVDGWKVAE